MEISVGEKVFSIWELRNELLHFNDGESIAYLTDFLFDDSLKNNISKLTGCETIVCECQYLEQDKELAGRNFHLTTKQTAEIAKQAEAKNLILVHVSDRYKLQEYQAILNEAREVFPESYFPENWNIVSLKNFGF